jgi:hypothetical protein
MTAVRAPSASCSRAPSPGLTRGQPVAEFDRDRQRLLGSEECGFGHWVHGPQPSLEAPPHETRNDGPVLFCGYPVLRGGDPSLETWQADRHVTEVRYVPRSSART